MSSSSPVDILISYGRVLAGFSHLLAGLYCYIAWLSHNVTAADVVYNQGKETFTLMQQLMFQLKQDDNEWNKKWFQFAEKEQNGAENNLKYLACFSSSSFDCCVGRCELGSIYPPCTSHSTLHAHTDCFTILLQFSALLVSCSFHQRGMTWPNCP